VHFNFLYFLNIIDVVKIRKQQSKVNPLQIFREPKKIWIKITNQYFINNIDILATAYFISKYFIILIL
jgi:hypothetical protein